MKNGSRDLRFVLKIKAKPMDLYRALTSARELCRWWLEGAETDARSGGRLRMIWPNVRDAQKKTPFPSAKVALRDAEGRFLDLDAGRKVSWSWQVPPRKKIPPLCTFYIEPKGRGAQLTMIHAGFSKEPSADPVFNGSAEGWEDCLSKLRLYLETGKTCKAKRLSFKDLPKLLKEAK